MILLSGAGLGFNKSRELGNRKKHLEMLMRNDYPVKRRNTLWKYVSVRCLYRSCRQTGGKVQRIFFEYSRGDKKKKGKPFGEIFRSCARESLDDQNFTREEKEKIFSLGERLGYLGMDMQLRQLQLLEEDLENEIQELNKDLKEKKKLYQSLGILLGILLAVLVA